MACAACDERVRIALPPADLAECAAEPQAPDLPPQNWTDLGIARAIQHERDIATLDYITGLRSWAGDCQSKVAGLRAWRETAGR
jgi:hypothetical protein